MSNGLRFLITTLIVTTAISHGWCHESQPKLKVTAGPGVFFYDGALSMDSGLALALGASYRLNQFLYLHAAVAVDPAQQTVPAAAKITTQVMVYNYNMNLTVARPALFGGVFQPFATAGVGGLLFDPSPVTIALGGGETLQVDGRSDHRFAFNVGAGVNVPFRGPVALSAEYRRFFYTLAGPETAGEQQGRARATNSLLMMGLLVQFK